MLPRERLAPPPPPAARAVRGRLPSLLGAVLIVVLAFAAYAPALRGGFILDDHLLLTDNDLIKAPDGLSRFWLTAEPVDYWPVTNSSLWLEWRLWGMTPTGYHVTNVALHALSALLLWAVLRSLSIPGGFLAALLFVVHPVNVESVAWITQRKNLLALAFLLLSVLGYARAEIRPIGRAAGAWYWTSLAAFALAMLSKASVAMLPLVLLGLVWWVRPLARRDFWRSAPFFLLTAVLVPVNVWFQSRNVSPGGVPPTGLERGLGAGAVVWFYLSKALLPIGLAFVYPKWTIRADVLWWWVPLLAAVLATGALIRYRETRARPLLLAWGVFCVALVPVMGLTDVGFMAHAQVADHYQHVALTAVVALLAAGWTAWWVRARARTRWLPAAVAVGAVAGMAILTWRQCALYVDDLTLFRATAAASPDSPFVHNNLGLALLGAEQAQDARREFERALQLRPDFPEVHYNLARVLLGAGETAAAVDHYRQALQGRPTYPEYHYGLGAALLQAGQLDEALVELQVALRLKPDYADARFGAGSALHRLRRLPEAAEQFELVIRARPDDAEAHNALGAVRLESGRLPEAAAAYGRAVQLRPELFEAQINLGRTLIQEGKQPEAIGPLTRAVNLNPGSADAHNDLAVAFANVGRLPEAIEHLREALRLAPDDAHARANLDEVLATKAQGLPAVSGQPDVVR